MNATAARVTPGIAALAAAAAINGCFGAYTGTMVGVVSLICAISVPIAFALRGTGALPTTVGLLHLPLAGLALTDVAGHDLRFSLAAVLLAISGLHAARCQSRRDEVVAAAIQLAVAACGLSQLDVDDCGRGTAIAWCAAWLVCIAPALLS